MSPEPHNTYDLRSTRAGHTRLMWSDMVNEGLSHVGPDQPYSVLIAGVLVDGTRKNVRVTFALEADVRASEVSGS